MEKIHKILLALALLAMIPSHTYLDVGDGFRSKTAAALGVDKDVIKNYWDAFHDFYHDAIRDYPDILAGQAKDFSYAANLGKDTLQKDMLAHTRIYREPLDTKRLDWLEEYSRKVRAGGRNSVLAYFTQNKALAGLVLAALATAGGLGYYYWPFGKKQKQETKTQP